MTITAKRKREMQAAGVKFGCHCDLTDGEEPDECVIEFGRLDDCIYANRHKTREGCPYWREIVEIEKGGEK